jgi:CBS domain-containing protein
MDIAKKIRDSRAEFVSVCQGGRFLGIVTQDAIVSGIVAKALNPKKEQASSIMSNHLPMISPGIDIIEGAKIMASHDSKWIPVVRKGKKLLGFLTVEDLLRESPTLAVLILTNQCDHRKNAHND